MPSLSDEQLIKLIGITDEAKGKALVSDLLSEGLNGLRCMGEEDVRDACASYVKRTDIVERSDFASPVAPQRNSSVALNNHLLLSLSAYCFGFDVWYDLLDTIP